jgi:hypothetical protein
VNKRTGANEKNQSASAFNYSCEIHGVRERSGLFYTEMVTEEGMKKGQQYRLLVLTFPVIFSRAKSDGKIEAQKPYYLVRN